MNRYQKKVSKEIKGLVKRDKFGRLTYKQARKIWRMSQLWLWCSPRGRWERVNAELLRICGLLS